jgi:hypothetical protein
LRTFLKKISFVYQAIVVELICDLGLEVPFWLKDWVTLNHKTIVSSVPWVNETPAKLSLLTLNVFYLVALSI